MSQLPQISLKRGGSRTHEGKRGLKKGIFLSPRAPSYWSTRKKRREKGEVRNGKLTKNVRKASPR